MTTSRIDPLIPAVPCCVEVAGLLAVLAGRLGALSGALADLSHGRHMHRAAEETMTQAAADLSTLCRLLHRVTLVNTPAPAGLRRITPVGIHPGGPLLDTRRAHML